jgi:uncharacterized membrane protein
MPRLNNKGWMLLGSLGAGAAALYFLDREQGQRRRSAFTARVRRSGAGLAEEVSKSARDGWNRLSGRARQILKAGDRKTVDDVVLAERVRSRIGKIVSYPHKIHVACDQGVVTLWGVAPEEERRPLLRTVGSVPGVQVVWNHLEVAEPSNISSRPADSLNRARKTTMFNLSPSNRALVGIAGIAAAFYGLRRKDSIGISLSLLGAALVGTSALKKNVHSLLAFSGDSPGFELEETIRVHAPVSDLYEFWVNPCNYPKVFSHVDSVERLGENLYRWNLTGPAGVRVHWDGIIARSVPNTLVEWKSLPGATVGNFGAVRLDPNYDASTRIHVHMFYHPPAGILGRILAEIFGSDPKKIVREDLKRMKMLFENDENLLKELNTGETASLIKTAGC